MPSISIPQTSPLRRWQEESLPTWKQDKSVLMEIKLAKQVGFCFGVKRAVGKVEKLLEEGRTPVYSIGDLIHNPQAMGQLKKNGLKIAKSLDDIKNGTLVVRAHGFPPSFIQEAKERDIKLVDATCPFVKKAQTALRSLDGKGYLLLVVGDSNHPEVKALLGFVRDKVAVIKGPDGLEKLNLEGKKKVGLLAQTTQAEENFQAVANKLIKDCPFELRIFNTICRAVASRQEETRRLAGEVDVMVVLGGKNSANTKALAKIAKDVGTPTYHIECFAELKDHQFAGKKSIGIVCGTSTPKQVRDEIVSKLKGRGYQMYVERRK